jgi:hypothetical protein
MKPIDTARVGVQFNELLVKTAEIANKITVVRSMTHGEAAHERGTHNMFTGYRPSPALTFPSFGSVVSHEYGPRADLPPYVSIPNLPAADAGAGYLGSAYGPFAIGSDPADANFTVRDLALPNGVDANRFATRQRLRDTVGRHFQRLEGSENIAAMDSFYQRAYSLVSSNEARSAFDIKAEPDAIRDDYGRNAAGQRMLLSRRLVEAGVRFVTLSYGGWDMHQKITDSMRKTLPAFDQAYAALIRDLDQRGLLASTLVMVSSEFGRTPRINNDAGRDHWPNVYSTVLAGGGVRGGVVYGASDSKGGEPADRPVTPADVLATVYDRLGIPPNTELRDRLNRPMQLSDGTVLDIC